MKKHRLIGGLVLVVISVLMFFTGCGETAGRIAFGVLGLTLIAVSRKNIEG